MALANDVEDVTDLLTKTKLKQSNTISVSEKERKLNTAEDVADIVKAINESKDVQALTLEGNTLGTEAAQAIADALSKRPEFQKALWNDMFTGRLRSEIPKALESLGDAVITAGAKLTEIDLCDNAFGPDGVKAVTKLLTSPSCFSLKVLKFNNNGLGIGGGKILSEALLQSHKASVEANQPLQLRVFIAGRNRLENEGATALAEAFEVMGSLEEISMPQNGINHQGVSSLAKSFNSNKGLKVVNLNDNIFTAKAAIAMAKILPSLPDLEVINFGDCMVKSKGATALAKALKNHNKLKELILAFGEIKKEAALSVVESLENKKNLTKLDLNGNCFGEDGIKSIRSKLADFNLGDVLGPLSDDEGDDDVDDDDEHEEEEEEEDETEEEDVKEEEGQQEQEKEEEEKEFAGDNEEKEKEIKNEKKKEVENTDLRNAEEFLLRPSLETFNTMPKAERIGLIKEALKVHITDVNGMCRSFVQASCVLKDNAETLLACSDAILYEAFRITEKPQTVVNCLLVHMGLLKGEDKIKPTTSDVTGSLLALEHAVKQEYFPKNLALYFTAFLSKPNSIMEGSSEAKNKLLQTLQLL